MQESLVSIITPFKNTGLYLKECIESIQNQTYKNWELLIVDDHSSDNSSEIIAGYAHDDSRIKLLKNQASGIISALRTGYTHSSGQFITRMDSDDIMAKNKLKYLVNNLREYGTGHVATGLVKYFSD